MKNITNAIHEHMLKKKNTITIKQANLFTTVVLFIFTIIFAYLLIVENYHDFANTLGMQESGHVVKHIEQKQEKLKTLLIKNTIAIATLAFILFAIALGLFKLLNTIVQHDIQVFLDFFNNAAHRQQVLNPNLIFFKDFKIMVAYANSMIDTISEQKLSLQELNANLEEKVQEKTLDLQKTNEKLLQEKKFSEDILQAQKQFLRYTVHETNTPLSVILTSIEIYLMHHEKNKQLSKIEAAAKNIVNIYDDLSYLVKKDQINYPKKVIDLHDFVKGRVGFFAEVAQMSKLAFIYTNLSEQYNVYINETKLQRIVDNTLSNAIKYTQPNEKIEVQLTQFGSYVDLKVASKSKEIKNTGKVFDPYYRETQKQEGFGIGLDLVRNICEESGVQIFVDSKESNTSFTYRFHLIGE